MLIDEVDVLFGRQFYGQIFNGGLKIKWPEAASLVSFIFQEKRAGRSISDVATTEAFLNLQRRFPPDMHRAIQSIAKSLVRNIEEWTSPEPLPDVDKERIGYLERGEVNFEMSQSNKTVFAYLAFALEGKINQAASDANLGIDLTCGRFSFAELPKSYRFVLGVTGTLKELLAVEGIRNVISDDYQIKKFTYAPSIFGERQLTFKEAEHVMLKDNEADWISAIEILVTKHAQAGNAVLVFWKNERMLKKLPSWADYDRITERVDKKSRRKFILAASSPGKITQLTRSFGRGVDFVMPQGHEVVVVQTFLSSLCSEETQIKGRTARQGNPGQYRIVLCAEHLTSKFGFSEENIACLKSGSGQDIKKLLLERQLWKTGTKAATMGDRKRKAADCEGETKRWEGLLFDPEAPVSQKRAKLAEWNTSFKAVHYTVLLDVSGSMGGSPWDQLVKAFNGFIEHLKGDPVAAAATQVSLVFFDHAAKTLSPSHSNVKEVQDIRHHFTGGGTNFAPAFKEWCTLLGRTEPSTHEVGLFLTDGGAAIPNAEINAILADHASRIKSLTCIGFGGGSDSAALNSICGMFGAKGIENKVANPNDLASLMHVFEEAAASQSIHAG